MDALLGSSDMIITRIKRIAYYYNITTTIHFQLALLHHDTGLPQSDEGECVLLFNIATAN